MGAGGILKLNFFVQIFHAGILFSANSLARNFISSQEKVKAPSTLILINLKTHLFSPVWPTVHTKTMFSVTENGAFLKRFPGWTNLKTPARWCSVDGRKRSFSKTLTSNGHVISVTAAFRPIPADAFHCFGGLIIHRTRLTTIPPHHLFMKSSLGFLFRRTSAFD